MPQTLCTGTFRRQRAATRGVAMACMTAALSSACGGDGAPADARVDARGDAVVTTTGQGAMSASPFGGEAPRPAPVTGVQIRSDAGTPSSQPAAIRPLSGQSYSERGPVVRGMSASATTQPPMPVAGAPAPGTMIVRSARVAVEVRELAPAVVAAHRAAERLGATVGSSTVRTGRNEQHQAILSFRVPSARFDSLLTALNSLGRVESVDAGSQDVGEEYVDVEARLANARRLESRFLDLLAHRTGDLGEVLRVEGELSRVRGEIERTEGRKRYLERSVATSTIDLTLHEPAAFSGAMPGRNPIAAAFTRAWRLLVATVAFCITALGVAVPVGLLAGLTALLVRLMMRRRRREHGAGG